MIIMKMILDNQRFTRLPFGCTGSKIAPEAALDNMTWSRGAELRRLNEVVSRIRVGDRKWRNVNHWYKYVPFASAG